MRNKERLIVGEKVFKTTVYLRIEEGRVFAVSTQQWEWALGKPREVIVRFLSRKHIRWHAYGYHQRRGDTWFYTTQAEKERNTCNF